MNPPSHLCRSDSESAHSDGEMKRAQAKERIEQYYFQLTEGCGNMACANPHCCSNQQVEALPPNQAAARALYLVTISAPLCDALRHKVRRTGSALASAPLAQQSAGQPSTSSCPAATPDVTTVPPAAAPETSSTTARTSAEEVVRGDWSADRLIGVVQKSAQARDYTQVIRAIGHIFSDVETLKRSFLRPSEPLEKGQLDAAAAEKDAAGAAAAEDGPPAGPRLAIDTESVRRVFSLLFSTGDSPFTAALANALTTLAAGLEVSLQFQNGYQRDPELLNVFLLVFEVPVLDSTEFLESALPRLCRAAARLPLAGRARLARLWSRYPAARLRRTVQTLQQLISVKVVEAESSPGYQANDDPAVTAPVQLLKVLFYASILGGRCDPASAHDQWPPPPPAAPSPGDPLQLRPAKERRPEEHELDPMEKELGVQTIDSRVPLVGFDEFYNEPLSDVVEMDHDYRYFKDHPDRFSFMRHPFVLTPATKSLGLYYDSRIRMFHERRLAIVHSMMHGAGQPYLRLRVRRDFIIEDALIELEILALENPGDLKKQLVVEFEGEQGVDEGGVSKEFFQLIVEAIFNPDYGMFTYNEETQSYWFNPTSFENDAQFTLIGVVVGLAIYNNVILDMRFPMVVYRKLMGQKGTFDDLREFSPTLHQSLTSMLGYDGEESMEEVFVQSFQVGYTDVFGAHLTHDLRPNGGQVMVNRDNVQEFVDSYADFLLNTSVQRQFLAFRRGFLMVTDESPLWTLFRPEEVELLVCGSKDYDWTELEAGAEYDGGYSRDSEPVRHFWEVVHQMSTDDKRKLLEFTTGSDRVPVGGLSKLKLIIARNGPDTDRLPTAHTCFNVLLLPEYRTRDKLRDMILKAINYSKGFGML